MPAGLIERYRDRLPLEPDDPIVTLNEGSTPLVEAQMTASAPSRTAADTAQVIPRSLNDPVGFAPSSFSHTSAPTRSDTRSASSSGVDPSSRETTGSSGPNGRRSR